MTSKYHLQDEYNNLYRALFNKPEQYIKIIEALCNVKKGITRDSTLITTYEVEESSYSGNIQAIITSDELFR